MTHERVTHKRIKHETYDIHNQWGTTGVIIENILNNQNNHLPSIIDSVSMDSSTTNTNKQCVSTAGRTPHLSIQQLLHLPSQSKDSDYVCGSCGTPLSTLHNTVLCGVDNGMSQLPQTQSECFDYYHLCCSRGLWKSVKKLQ